MRLSLSFRKPQTINVRFSTPHAWGLLIPRYASFLTTLERALLFSPQSFIISPNPDNQRTIQYASCLGFTHSSICIISNHSGEGFIILASFIISPNPDNQTTIEKGRTDCSPLQTDDKSESHRHITKTAQSTYVKYASIAAFAHNATFAFSHRSDFVNIFKPVKLLASNDRRLGFLHPFSFAPECFRYPAGREIHPGSNCLRLHIHQLFHSINNQLVAAKL